MTKIKLIAVAKNESINLPNWIFHHLRIGIDYIEVYINNSDDNSLAICKKIKKVEPRFNYYLADALMKDCIKRSTSFQLTAYNRSLKITQTLQDDISHILLLDLDEYLTPFDLQSNLKDLIKHNPPVDIFSFLWYSDDYNSNENTFSKAYKPNTNIYMMYHFKSMARVEIISRCSHHNFHANKSNESLLNLVAGTTNTFLDDNFNTDAIRSKIKDSFKNEMYKIKPMQWFVYHRIYTTPIEYLASLLRGNSHDNDDRPIKANRWGRAPIPGMDYEAIQLNFPDSTLNTYNKDYDNFLKKCKLYDEILMSHNMVYDRARAAIQAIRKNSDLLGLRPGTGILRGIDLDHIECQLNEALN